MDEPTLEPITYKRLGDTLTALGFARSDTKDYVAFRNAEHNALIALPITEPEMPARPAHLIAAQSAVAASGIVSEQIFQQMLRREHSFAIPPTEQSEAA